MLVEAELAEEAEMEGKSKRDEETKPDVEDVSN